MAEESEGQDTGAQASGQASVPPKLLPAWLLGWGNLPLAVTGSVALIALPDLLASAHVPEGEIAAITSLFLAASFISIPLTPLLDWRFSRRSYAIFFAILAALSNFGTLLSIGNISLLSVLLFLAGISTAMCVAAMGGWFGNLVPAEKKDAFGAWLSVVNFGAGGVVSMFIVYLVRALPYPFGEAAVSAPVLLVLPLFLLTPCQPADRKLASESFAAFARDVAALFCRKDVRWVLLVFLAPSASFALTNTLTGFGHDFHTSDEMVGVIGGAGVAVAGVFGALIVPQFTKRVSPVAVYLLVGLVGACFTASLISAPRDAEVFGLAMIGQNVFQAAAFTAANAITLRAMGHDNPLAATQFGVLIGVTQVPLTYMQMIDGRAYGFGGVVGTFAADALISGTACVILGLLYWRFSLKSALASVPGAPIAD
jgi:PAT family beta-lactamase induction signal transducer AmpG